MEEENKKQPQSLRSLADYKNKINKETSNNSNLSSFPLPSSLPSSSSSSSVNIRASPPLPTHKNKNNNQINNSNSTNSHENNNRNQSPFLSTNEIHLEEEEEEVREQVKEMEREEERIELNGLEIKNSKATFISVDSDLSEIFGNIRNEDQNNFNQGYSHNNNQLENEESFNFIELQNNFIHLEENKEIEKLKNIIIQLKEENNQLITSSSNSSSSSALQKQQEENLQLQTELQSLKEQIKNLQYDIKDKDDQVFILLSILLLSNSHSFIFLSNFFFHFKD